MVKDCGRRRVLVVDDDPDLVRGLELYLRLEGFEAACALDGMGAIEEISTNQPSAVILDIKMPVVGGFEVDDGSRTDRVERSRNPQGFV